MAQVHVLVYVLDLADLVVRKIYPFQRRRRVKVEHLGQLVGGRVEFDQMLDNREGGEGG